jgi:hypothetical protein
MVRAVFFECQNARRAINVALHKMAAETSARCECPLEIDGASRAQCFQVCAIESLFEEIEGELFVVMDGDSKAATIHRDAVADLESIRDKWRDDQKLGAAINRVEPEDTADFFDQAGKHELIVHRLTQIHADFFRNLLSSGKGAGLPKIRGSNSERKNREIGADCEIATADIFFVAFTLQILQKGGRNMLDLGRRTTSGYPRPFKIF